MKQKTIKRTKKSLYFQLLKDYLSWKKKKASISISVRWKLKKSENEEKTTRFVTVIASFAVSIQEDVIFHSLVYQASPARRKERRTMTRSMKFTTSLVRTLDASSVKT